ncbi:MAG TPA: FKBP-type peptidyl-prolyl cis-trans isomerase [Thermoanaerobaculia bacterium]|jgi:peptidylprolyl isomerase
MTRERNFLFLAAALAAPLVFAADPIPAPPDVAAPPADAAVTASGLASKVLVAGTGGEHPDATSHVVVHYTGWTTDGKTFDSSVTRGSKTALPLDRVIDGWTEGLQLMVAGEKRRFWIPEKLAYAGKPDRPKGMLVFDVELFDFVKTPSDVAAPPADAEVTKSGLASKILRPGTGSEKPRRSSRVTVHYSGWTTDGAMFDSSVTRGQPTSFGLTDVIKGWIEGLQLMVVGEKRRFWIPDKLAYKGVPDRPQGTLVFDVELISFQ